MPIKIGFEVISSSGEEENFRASELNYHGPSVRGWRSPANAPFPHHLTLKLKLSAVLHQIQMLTHQYLIPERVDICTSSNLNYDDSKTEFEYLGFITFSDNKATGFRSRELKSIFIPAIEARYIKLLIHSNHANVKNIWNQVALIAINVLGDPVPNSQQTNNNLPRTVSGNLSNFSPYDDLAFEMYVDQDTANIIKILESKKLHAVQEEQFDYANALKITIKNLRAAGEILGLYEQEKRQAIIREDYDRAKKKKKQMDRFRRKIYTALDVHQFLHLNQVPRNEIEFKNFEREDNVARKRNLNTRLGNEIFIKDTNKNLMTKNYQSSMTPANSLDALFHSKSQNSMLENYNTNDCLNSNYISVSTSHPQLGIYASNSSERNEGCSEFGDQYDADLSSRSGSINSYSESGNTSENEFSPFKKYERWPGKVPESQSLNTFASHLINNQKSYTKNDTEEKCNTQDFATTKSILPISSLTNFESKTQIKTSVSEYKIKNHEIARNVNKSTFEAYEERTLPALKSYHGNEVVRSCQFAQELPKKSSLNEKEKKQASLSISVFGMEQVEKFYSKNFTDKEEGLKWLQQELKTLANSAEPAGASKTFSFNRIARAATFLLHRALRDKVFSVYSLAAQTVRIFFGEYVPQRVTASEVARSVEKLFPELLLKSGDVMPRIHNMAAHTLLTMAECKEVRCLNIIPVHLSRPLTASIHPRLALSRLEMVEQLILSQGISKEKKSGLSCRTLAEFGSSGLDHPAEPVRKVSERILLEVYKINPRIVRKQLPPDDNVTRRNLLYRHLFQKFDEIDGKRKLEESNYYGGPSKNCDSFYLKSEEKESSLNNDDNNNLSHDLNLKNICEKKSLKLRFPTPAVVRKPKDSSATEKGSKSVEKICRKPKFPSLADSIDTAKARMVLGVSGPRPAPRKKSSIPLPVSKLAGNQSVRPLTTSPSGCKQKQSTFTSKLPKKVGKENFHQPELQANILLESLKCEDKSLDVVTKITDCPENNDEGIFLEETAKLSDSMMTSIKEMESSLGYTTDDQSFTHFKSCIFCMSSKKWSTEEGLTNHYLKECLMLTTCKYCKQVIEISAFTNHLLGECNNNYLFLKCNNCNEAILKESYETHKCFVEEESPNSRCPFCHANIGDGDTCWRKHLVESNHCLSHPRKLSISSKPVNQIVPTDS